MDGQTIIQLESCKKEFWEYYESKDLIESRWEMLSYKGGIYDGTKIDMERNSGKIS